MGNRIQSTSTTPAPELTLEDKTKDGTRDPITENVRIFDEDKSGGLSAAEINKIGEGKGAKREDVRELQIKIFNIASNNGQGPNSAAVFYGLAPDTQFKMLTEAPTPEGFKNNLARFNVAEFVKVLKEGDETSYRNNLIVVDIVTRLEPALKEQALAEIDANHPELQPLFEQAEIKK